MNRLPVICRIMNYSFVEIIFVQSSSLGCLLLLASFGPFNQVIEEGENKQQEKNWHSGTLKVKQIKSVTWMSDR
jgi:hypothetical protein